METATFAGGCFWCTEAIFERLKGVESVTSGYTGGDMDNPSYEAVSSGNTGHAEAIQVVFDPTVIPYEKLLEVFWKTHDPTTLNQQGNDVGTQYRSAIFYHSDEQRKQAEASRERAQAEHDDPIVTDIKPFQKFYTAEEYHQKYYDQNPTVGYCQIVIDPKVQKFLKEFSAYVKEEYR